MDPLIDPLALLRREHDRIFEHLRMVEAVIGPQGAGSHERVEPDRVTLRELFRFFTGQVGVHFKREAVLIRALDRMIPRNRGEHEQFQILVDEHHALKADAEAIAYKLTKNAASAPTTDDRDPFGICSFIGRYRGHLSCEERILFVLASMRLTTERKQRIGHRMLQI